MADEDTPKEKAEGKPHSGIPEAIFLVSHIFEEVSDDHQ